MKKINKVDAVAIMAQAIEFSDQCGIETATELAESVYSSGDFGRLVRYEDNVELCDATLRERLQSDVALVDDGGQGIFERRGTRYYVA